jgi:HNH endonuclease/NUMOD4 motif
MNQQRMEQLLPEHYIRLLDYPNYDVSSWGNVRNRITGKILKQSINVYGYKVVNIYGYGMKKVHRLIACAFLNNSEHKRNVDHKNRDRTNNNIINLRFATNVENGQNMSKRNDNTSGVSGVRWNKDRNKWHVRITVNKKKLHLGLFINFDDAVKIRKEAEIKYFGEFQAK